MRSSIIHSDLRTPNCMEKREGKEGKNQSGQIIPQNNAESAREADTARFINPWMPPRLSSWPVRFGKIDHDSFGVVRLCVVIEAFLSTKYRNRQTSHSII